MVEPIQGGGGDGSFADRRARLSAKPLARQLIYGENRPNNILHPLWETGGLMWPYTPTVFDTANVLYDHYDVVHANQPFAAFKSVGPKEIQCTGPFTAQNQAEAKYCVAAIHFLRTVTKMFFGIGNNRGDDAARLAVELRGTPPPILMFNAYGTAMFHNVPVIVTTYNVEFPQDVDYVQVVYRENVGSERVNVVRSRTGRIDPSGATGNLFVTEVDTVTGDVSAWVPTKFVVSVTMQVQNTPNRWRRSFNLNDFRTGQLIKKGGWV